MPENISIGAVTFTSPADWKAAKGKMTGSPPGPACFLSSLTGNAKVHVTVHPSKIPPAEARQSLKSALLEDCKPYATSADAFSKLEIKELEWDGGIGFYANFVDPDMVGKPAEAGIYKTATPVVLLIGSNLVRLTIWCDEIEGADYTYAMITILSMKTK